MLDQEQAGKIEAGLVIPLYKPVGWTSFQAVKKVRSVVFRALDKRIRIGHAGTLDPLAQGLLLICTGRATRTIERLQELPKEYTGTFHLGATTPSYDLETQPENERPYQHITQEIAQEAASRLTGAQMQAPPFYSARWVEGKRAYSLARQGLEPKIDPRPVIVETFEITAFNLPEINFRIVCSKGTYIRSLARDFGTITGTGAYLKNLVRTAIGNYHINHSLRPETLNIEEILEL